ncbi:MAG: hypothetical protein V9G19_06565 [Tetrasphaera sp.]
MNLAAEEADDMEQSQSRAEHSEHSLRARADLVGALAQTLQIVVDARRVVRDGGARDADVLDAEIDMTVDIVARRTRAYAAEPDLASAVDAVRRAWPLEAAHATGSPAAAPQVTMPADLLRAGRGEVILYCRMLADVTEAGRSLQWLPAPVPKILADAEAVLGDAVVAQDHELTARLLATWPLLGAPWTAPARCALDRLLAARAAYGFLPPTTGPVAAARDELLRTVARPSIALALALSLALEHGPIPQPWTPSEVDLRVRDRLGAGGPVVDATLLVSAAVLRADDHRQLRAVLDIAADGVAADSALALAIDELSGTGPFAARAA